MENEIQNKYKLNRLREFELEANKHTEKHLSFKTKGIIFISSFIVILSIVIGVILFIKRNEMIQAQNDYKTIASHATDLYIQSREEGNSNTIPISTSMTKDQWDNYFDNLSSQISLSITALQNLTFSNNNIDKKNLEKLNTYLATEKADFNYIKNYIILEKSHNDLKFQIDSEKVKLKSDYLYEKDLQSIVGGNADQANNLLQTENAQLNNDIATSDAQNKELLIMVQNNMKDLSFLDQETPLLNNPKFE